MKEMKDALTIYFNSFLRSNLLSRTMIIASLFSGLLYSAIGAYGANGPLPMWFSFTYIFFLFAIMGGLARQVIVSSGAYNYLVRHAGINPIKLTLVLFATYVITSIIFAPLMLVLFFLMYYTAGKLILSINIAILASAIILSSVFITALGIFLGLIMIGKAITSRIASFIWTIPLILFFISIFVTPPNASIYNPITAMELLLTISWENGVTSYAYIVPMSSNVNVVIPVITILVSSVILLLISTLLLKRIREVNIYDVAQV